MSSVKVSHIEIVQSIQNAINSEYHPGQPCYGFATTGGVPLITGKRTFARVYLDFNLTSSVSAEGELEVGYPDFAAGSTIVKLISNADWHLDRLPTSLMEQRNNWANSLNFELPPDVIAAPGTKMFRLNRLIDLNTGDEIEITPPESDSEPTPYEVTVNFTENEKFALRVLIFRYRDVEDDEVLEPMREEVDGVRRYIERVFPVTEFNLEDEQTWTVIRTQANRDFFALDQAQRYEREHDEVATKMLSNLLRQIMTYRNQDIMQHPDFGQGSGGHPGFQNKTFYIGVFSDPRARFGGVALDSPRFPVVHGVAASATDISGQTGAHELGHLLGRHHPGIPQIEVHGRDIGQYQLDSHACQQMAADGSLSLQDTGEEQYLGVDMDRFEAEPMVLEHKRYFDLMTYRNPQWLSDYNYREVFNRLTCINELNLDCGDTTDRCWTIICSYDIERKDGQFLHVLPGNYRTPQKPDEFLDVNETVSALSLLHIYGLRYTRVIPKAPWKLFKRLQKPFVDPDFKRFAKKLFCGQHKTADDHPCRPYYVQVEGYNMLLALIFSENLDHLRKNICRYREQFEADIKGNADKLRRLNKLEHVLFQDKKDALGDLQELRDIFLQNCVVAELRQPEIRIFTNYAEADGDASCIEEDIDAMWAQAEEIYYRRVGSIDRFPHGLLQATVYSKPDSGGQPPISITLMIDGVVVDKFAQHVDTSAEVDIIRDAIFALTDDTFDNVGPPVIGNGSYPDDYECVDRPPSNSLVYDIRRDSYFLNFHWPMAVIRCDDTNDYKGVTITTTIQCWRQSPCDDRYVVQDKWETVCVTDELHSQVWISPDLFQIDYDDQACKPNRPSAKKPERLIGSRANDELKFRFVITIGFYQYTSLEYTARPELIQPRRGYRHRLVDSEDKCPIDCRYDDGYYSTLR
jgi:hypothetical protein